MHLEPKALEVLSALARRPREVISKEDVLAVVWQAPFVTDQVLRQLPVPQIVPQRVGKRIHPEDGGVRTAVPVGLLQQVEGFVGFPELSLDFCDVDGPRAGR